MTIMYLLYFARHKMLLLTFMAQQPQRMSREDHDQHVARLNKYYLGGTWYGQSVSSTIYTLATLMERVDNDFLW